MDKHKQKLNDINAIEHESLPQVKTDQIRTSAKNSKPVRTKFGSVKKLKWLKKGPLTRKELVLFGAALMVIVATGCGLIWWMNQVVFSEDSPMFATKKTETKYYSPLSGIEVVDEAATKRAVTAVMIENSDAARPQSGLAEADVVFEAVAEGGITRFIALYQPSRPELIGPVRSLRPYYVDWAAGFDPSVAHVGGSPESLDMIRSGNYGVDVDQFFNAGSYWRANDRYAPHNVYTNSDRLDDLNASKGKTTSAFTFSPRIDEKKSATPTASHIDIAVSSGMFGVSYGYNQETNTYNRSQGGEPHIDREKGQISPKVVVALKTNVSLAGDGSHMAIATAGSGTAYVFQNGTVIEGTWSKAGPRDQLFIKDAEGKDIALVRGQTWITTIANERSVTWQ